MSTAEALFTFLIRFGDNALVLGHRTSEWCGHGPVLEEDIALANTALDLIGQCRLWLDYAREVENAHRTANDLAFLRDTQDFRNVLLAELPNGDFGQTIMRQFLFDAFQVPYLGALRDSTDPRIAEIAAKSVKEAQYHLERSAETVIALGDGTKESHERMQAALDLLWPYVGELFEEDDHDRVLASQRIAPLPSAIRADWETTVKDTLTDATLTRPDNEFAHSGGRNGRLHTEHLGHMLATMQVLHRSHPGATW